jgi:uncharacterized protein YodC (DUF2158 family)
MDERHAFDTGDTVRLRFGGPLMTVLSGSDTTCCCMWFEGTRLRHGRFEPEVVELVERAVRLIPTHASNHQRTARA